VNDPVLYEEVNALKEAVVTKEPVSIVVPAFKAKEAVVANELDIAKELVTALEDETANEALTILFEPNGPNTFEPVTKDDVNELAAQDEVPCREPVKLPVKLPVLYEEVKALKEAVVTKEPVSIVVPAFNAKDAVNA
jgi:hypothetical protein